MLAISNLFARRKFSLLKWYFSYTFLAIVTMGAINNAVLSSAYATPAPSVSSTIIWTKSDTSTGKPTIIRHSIWYKVAHLLGFGIQHNSVNPQVKEEVHPIARSLNSTVSNNPFTQFLKHYVLGPFTLKPSSNTLAHSTVKIPVILVHGTWTNAGSMIDIYKSLDQAGIPAYATTFGRKANSLVGLLPSAGEVAPVAESEKQLADFIDQVKKETGATKVDLIGHSQGGLLIKDYIAHDTKNDVQAVVDLGATNHGTTFLSLPIRFKPYIDFMSALLGKGATDQSFNSEFIHDLNQTPDTKAGIHYLVLTSKNDFMSAPYENTYLKAVPGADVINQEVHSLPGVQGDVSHIDLPFNPGVVNAITRYIETKGEPDASSESTVNSTIPVSRSQIERGVANIRPNFAQYTSPNVALLN